MLAAHARHRTFPLVSPRPQAAHVLAHDARGLARDPNARPELASREVRAAAPRGNDAAAIVKAGGGAPAGTPK
jgi:hypothetical protein